MNAGIPSAAAARVLDAAGTAARYTESLWHPIVWSMAVIYVLLSIVILIAALGRRTPAVRDHDAEPARADPDPDPRRERRIGRVVTGSVAMTAVILLVYLLAGYSVGHAIVGLSGSSDLNITVTGHQWWWEVHYDDPVAGNTFTTANEIHIPVGRNVDVHLIAADVIHSFWVPELAGKQDLIPGRNNHVLLHAERPGEYAGECAEFCGFQHAHMRFVVVAESDDDLHRWMDSQRAPAAGATGEKEKRGEQLFVSGPCAMCHTVRGTIAGSRAGPELTHVASRRTLAAGTLANTRENLMIWMLDSQSIKPGNRMPQITMNAEELDELASYLETLR